MSPYISREAQVFLDNTVPHGVGLAHGVGVYIEIHISACVRAARLNRQSENSKPQLRKAKLAQTGGMRYSSIHRISSLAVLRALHAA